MQRETDRRKRVESRRNKMKNPLSRVCIPFPPAHYTLSLSPLSFSALILILCAHARSFPYNYFPAAGTNTSLAKRHPVIFEPTNQHTMKKLRKILLVTAISIFGLLALAFLLPIILKKQILAKVKDEINSQLVAVVDFSDADISLLRRFPRMSVQLENISVKGKDVFEKDTLLSAKHIDLSMNFMSMFGDEMTIYRADLQTPRIKAIVLDDGQANWNITKPSTSTETDTSSGDGFRIKLNRYTISDGYIVYDDRPLQLKMEIAGLDHEGSGDLTAAAFTLHTNTKSEAVYFAYEGVPYLNHFKTSIASDILIDTKTSTYSFRNSNLKLNELEVTADGLFQLVNDSTYHMDMKFASPSTEFKSILSLVPGIYQESFKDLETKGKASFEGFVKGDYSPTAMPAYQVKMDVQDGYFKYPDLPSPVKNIRFKLDASNPDGQPDNMVVKLDNGHIEMDNEPFDFNFLFRNPETEQYIDAKAKGRINLGNISKFVKLEEGTRLSGSVQVDAFAKGAMLAMQGGAGNFGAGGFLQIANLNYASKELPQPIQNGNMKIDIENSGGVADNTTVKITNGHIELGKDPIDFFLSIQRPMTNLLFNGGVKANLDLASLKPFMDLEKGTDVSGKIQGDIRFAGSKADIDRNNYAAINVNGTTVFNNINFVSPDYPGGVQLQKATLDFNPKNITLSDLQAKYGQSNFTASGVLDNLIGYALNNETLQGKVDLAVDRLDLNALMGTSTATTTADTTAMTPFAVPGNMDLSIRAAAKQVQYDKVAYRNINGTLSLSNETVYLKDLHTEALDGTIMLNGYYSTHNSKTNPEINIEYDVKNISIQKAFLAFNTVQKLMPVGQYLDGKLTSSLAMKGKLKGDMMPDLASLTGKGSLLVIEGALKKFAPLDKIASTLNVAQLSAIDLKDLKTYVEFANGKVLVKPFQLKVKDIDMQVGGMHGLDLSMDYLVQMKLPRSYLGSSGNQLVNNLASAAASKGVAVNVGETVNLVLKLGGSINAPTLQTDLKDAAGNVAADLKQQATAFAQQKADTAKQVLKDSAQAITKQLTQDLKSDIKNSLLGTRDSTGKKTNLDSTKKKATETLKNTFKGVLGKKKE